MDAYFAKNEKVGRRLRNLSVGTTFVFVETVGKNPVWMVVDDASRPEGLISCVCLPTGNLWRACANSRVIKVKPAEPRVRFIPDV